MRYAPPRAARGRRTTAGALAALALLAGCGDDTGPTAAGTPEAGSPAAATATYTAAIGDDWSYASKADLKAQNIFWWYRSEDVYQDVDLVPDATFGQVARIRFRQSDETGFAPKMRRQLAQPLDHAWYRWRIRYAPGWTTVGPNPTGYANSWKMSFWTWENWGGRGAIQLSNGDQNIMEWNVQDRSTGKFQSYAETVLPGSVGQPLGRVGEAWQDGEWYEYVIHYHRVSDTQARQEYWYRRLTNGGQIANEPFTYHGADFTGSPMPRMAGIELGVNKNKSNPTTMYVFWGPWEVVDGSRHPDPYGLAGGQGTPPPAPARTLTGVTLTPGTASVAAGDTVRFAAAGRYSDGTTGSVSVTWSATGGTVASGLYTAGTTAGTFRVIAASSSGAADTAVVTVTAPAAPTLQQVTVSPGTASVTTGGQVQFAAQGRFSDGSTSAVPVTWSATGGSVSSSGAYTAGATAGTFRVIAVAQGSTRADTAAVTVTAPAPTTGSYARLAGDDWTGYTASSQLSRYYGSTDLASVALVADPVFGKAVRVTQRAGSTLVPRLEQALPSATDRVWYRWRVKFSPGWRAGSEWTMAQFGWSGLNGAMGAGYAAGDRGLSFSVRDAAWRYVRYSETLMPGSAQFGAAPEHADGQWYEWVMLWEKTGSTTGRAHWWARPLTRNGAVVNAAWSYYGISLSGSTTPSVQSVRLGAGDLGSAPSADQQLYLGPWEAVDGSRYANPFGMPGH